MSRFIKDHYHIFSIVFTYGLTIGLTLILVFVRISFLAKDYILQSTDFASPNDPKKEPWLFSIYFVHQNLNLQKIKDFFLWVPKIIFCQRVVDFSYYNLMKVLDMFEIIGIFLLSWI